MALVACGADAILPEHSIHLTEQLQRPDVREAMRRIHVVQDPALNHYHHCRVDLTTAAGTTHSKSLTGSRGSPQTPLSDTEVIQKFQMLAMPTLGAERTQEVIDRVMAIEHLQHPRDLFALF